MKLLKAKLFTQIAVAGLMMQSSVALADQHSSTFSAIVNKPQGSFTLDISGVRASTSPLMPVGEYNYSGAYAGSQWTPTLPLWNVRPVCGKRLTCRNDGMRVLSDTRLMSALNSFVWETPTTLDQTKLSDFTVDVTMTWGSDVRPPTIIHEFTSSIVNLRYYHLDGSDAEQDTINFLTGYGFTEGNVGSFMRGAIDLQGLIATWGEEDYMRRGDDQQSSEPPTESELKHFTDNVKVTAEAKANVKVSETGVSAEVGAGVKAETNLTNLFRGIGAAAQSAGSAIASAAGWWWHYTKEGADSIRDAAVNGDFAHDY